MRKKLLFVSLSVVLLVSEGFLPGRIQAQQCLTSGYCANFTNQYPATTFSTTSSAWTAVSAYMNAGNWTLFNVISGNTYEWSYCEAHGGVSTNWDAQLTLINNASSANLCFSDNMCGTSGNAPYISWVANYTGVVKLLTSQSNCTSNTGSPYNTLVWRQANGGASTTVLGIDVSHYEGTMNWTQVKADPNKYAFAWAKATEGTTLTDAQYVTNTTNGTAAGIAMGAYHFAHPETNSASTEATFFLSVAASYIKTCSLPPALDLEDPSGGPSLVSSMTSAALTSWVQTWMTAVKNQTGITPILYTSGSIASYLGSAVNIYPLWIADPDGSSTAPPANIGVWTNWAFKQYSWTGTVSGVTGTGNVDIDVFNGDANAFNAFIGCTTGITENIKENNFILYPNPASEMITLENISPNNNQEMTVFIYTMQGQLILQQLIQQQKTEFTLSGYPNGMYIVKVYTSEGMEVRKFIKK
jgi:GH25 family lysozyme M1 (1,4-beta-N-acetylmuramidase)